MILQPQKFKNKNKNKKQNKKLTFFAEKFGKIFWLIFKNFQLKFLDFGQKMADFTRFWKN